MREDKSNLNIFVYDDKKVAFIRIAKTGSTSIKRFFGKESRRVEIDKISELNDYFKFTFVRNPYDRFFSFYCDKVLGQQRYDKKVTKWLSGIGIQKGAPFKEAIIKLKDHVDNSDVHIRPQSFFIYNNKRIIPDFIGRFETLEDDFEKVKKIVDIKKKLSHLNVNSNKYSKKDFYDDETYNMIYDIYKNDFDMLGYSK